MGSLDGRVVIVAGGGSRTGQNVCTALGARGAHLCIADPDLYAADEAARAAQEQLVPALSVQSDARDRQGMDELVRRTLIDVGEPWGGVLVVRAGAGFTSLLRAGEAEWDRAVSSEVKRALFFIQAVGEEQIRLRRGGRLVLVVENPTGEEPSAGQDALAAGLQALVRLAAVELADQGVTVNAVAPRWPLPGRAPEGLLPAECDSVAQAAAFLVTPEAGEITSRCFALKPEETAPAQPGSPPARQGPPFAPQKNA